MLGWTADFFRSLGAPWYWNARKQWFVVRGRRGQCPCHNESDSGRPGETRCEAVVYWNNPRRFARHVCPLLKQNAEGEWRCSVPPERVRTFWVRPVAWYALLGGTSVGLVGGLVWGTMRGVGYEVSPRQILWPRAWSELRGVRADFFVAQARTHLEGGRFREAIAALGVAADLRPEDYETAMLMAQVTHLTRPESVDLVYRRLYEIHPERRSETSRVWFRSLLARGQLGGVAELARRRLMASGEDWAVWAHALMFAERWVGKWEVLEDRLVRDHLPAAARSVLDLEVRIRRAEALEAKRLLVAEPVPQEAFAVVHRAERLVEFGDPMEALLQLKEHRAALPAKDYVRLVLAAHAAARNRAALEREVRGLLARRGAEHAGAVALVAQHLVIYPNAELLDECRAAALLLPAGTEAGEAWAALYCAAAVAGRSAWLPEISAKFASASEVTRTNQERVDQLIASPNQSPLKLLTVVRPMSIELNYAILERVLVTR